MIISLVQWNKFSDISKAILVFEVAGVSNTKKKSLSISQFNRAGPLYSDPLALE